jgi:hypothetical protein
MAKSEVYFSGPPSGLLYWHYGLSSFFIIFQFFRKLFPRWPKPNLGWLNLPLPPHQERKACLAWIWLDRSSFAVMKSICMGSRGPIFQTPKVKYNKCKPGPNSEFYGLPWPNMGPGQSQRSFIFHSHGPEPST